MITQYSLCTGPMVLLMCRLFTFCQCFFSRDTRKFMARWMFWTSSSSVMFTLPTGTLRHNTFFIWNLMVDDLLQLSLLRCEFVHRQHFNKTFVTLVQGVGEILQLVPSLGQELVHLGLDGFH